MKNTILHVRHALVARLHLVLPSTPNIIIITKFGREKIKINCLQRTSSSSSSWSHPQETTMLPLFSLMLKPKPKRTCSKS